MLGFLEEGWFAPSPRHVWGWYQGTAMVVMLYTMQSKVDWFLTRGKNVLFFSDSTVLIINIIFTLKKIIKTPKKDNAINTVWNELCHGPDISRYEPVFLRKTEVWRGIGFRTRSVYIEYQDPYFSWIELFPRHGISDIRTRHWNAACQDL